MDDEKYRSIGETLELLRQEFPEITISKIRFLETQGLIAPERTTNGYRKFYDHDIERLSFVLRQQREQFLPLKVIKDRITEKEPGVFVLDPNKGRFPQQSKINATKFEKDIFGDPIVSSGNKNSNNKPKPLLESNTSKVRSQLDGAQQKQRVSSTNEFQGTSSNSSRERYSNGASAPSAHSSSIAASPQTSQKSSRQAKATAESVTYPDNPGQIPTQTPRRPRLFALPSSSSLAEKYDDVRFAHEQDEYLTDPGSEDFGDDAEKFPKNSYTAREIAEKADLSLVQLNELVTFGLLAPASIRGQQIFSSVDLDLALLARQFAKYGLEARHLKMYKVSAEREASFLEQVILPILANKSNKSRAKAEAALTQLGDIGSRFRTQLLERAIDKILNS